MSKDEAKPHVLLVEDARDIREPLARYLREHGYRATTAADAANARKVMKAAAIDLVVLDIMMPGEDGLSLCRSIRETSQIPVILLTARGEEVDRIIGLEMGADDYIAKPFSPRELIARVAAVLRRTQALPPRQKPPRADRVKFGDWVLDTGQRELIGGDGVALPLSSGEFRLLAALLERPKIALTRNQLLDLTKGRDADLFDRSIDNHVSRLRKKIEPDPKNPRYIKTVWGGGYIFVMEPGNRMKLKFWPRTLVVQLIAVTAAAVTLSNIAVAIWFEQGNEQQTQAAIDERVLDRAAAVAMTLSAIPATSQSRSIVLHSMSSRIWHFSEMHGAYQKQPMTEEEAGLATRLDGMLPGPNGATVRMRRLPATLRPGAQSVTESARIMALGADQPPGADMIEAIVPLDKNTQLSAVFFRLPLPLPVEIIAATIGAILLTAGGAAVIAQRVARPLSELTSAASVVARGGNAPHVDEKGPDDVRNAAIAFNAMTEKVTRTLDSQRQLLSAVGHDLRTPITAMRINLEFIADRELRDGLEKNLDELQDLTESVLSAARGAGGESKRNVDLSALVESLCTDLDEIGEPVTWELHQPAPISCRPNEIRRAVRNLVENAVAYGGKADVRLADTPEGYEVVVDDEGPGIPEGDRQRVFEPFVRLESSRNEETGGTGLGLTLVKAIVEGHGGAVVLENRSAGGLRARLRLPRMAAAAE